MRKALLDKELSISELAIQRTVFFFFFFEKIKQQNDCKCRVSHGARELKQLK